MQQRKIFIVFSFVETTLSSKLAETVSIHNGKDDVKEKSKEATKKNRNASKKLSQKVTENRNASKKVSQKVTSLPSPAKVTSKKETKASKVLDSEKQNSLNSDKNKLSKDTKTPDKSEKNSSGDKQTRFLKYQQWQNRAGPTAPGSKEVPAVILLIFMLQLGELIYCSSD